MTHPLSLGYQSPTARFDKAKLPSNQSKSSSQTLDSMMKDFENRIRNNAPSVKILGLDLAPRITKLEASLLTGTKTITLHIGNNGLKHSLTVTKPAEKKPVKRVAFADLTSSEKANSLSKVVPSAAKLNPQSILIKKRNVTVWKFEGRKIDSPAARKLKEEQENMQEDQLHMQKALSTPSTPRKPLTPAQEELHLYLLNRQIALSADPTPIIHALVKGAVEEAMPTIKYEVENSQRYSIAHRNPSMVKGIAGLDPSIKVPSRPMATQAKPAPQINQSMQNQQFAETLLNLSAQKPKNG